VVVLEAAAPRVWRGRHALPAPRRHRRLVPKPHPVARFVAASLSTPPTRIPDVGGFLLSSNGFAHLMGVRCTRYFARRSPTPEVVGSSPTTPARGSGRTRTLRTPQWTVTTSRRTRSPGHIRGEGDGQPACVGCRSYRVRLAGLGLSATWTVGVTAISPGPQPGDCGFESRTVYVFPMTPAPHRGCSTTAVRRPATANIRVQFSVAALRSSPREGGGLDHRWELMQPGSMVGSEPTRGGSNPPLPALHNPRAECRCTASSCKPRVKGSTPFRSTSQLTDDLGRIRVFDLYPPGFSLDHRDGSARVAQMAEATLSDSGGWGFESLAGYAGPVSPVEWTPPRQGGDRRFESGTGRRGRVAEWFKASPR
jgi:hypothetical protein